MQSIKPIQQLPDININDDGSTDVNQLRITITQPTTVFQGTLDELNAQLADAQQHLQNNTDMFNTAITNDQARIDSIQAMIDSITPQIISLPARVPVLVDPALPVNPTNDMTPPQQITP